MILLNALLAKKMPHQNTVKNAVFLNLTLQLAKLTSPIKDTTLSAEY